MLHISPMALLLGEKFGHRILYFHGDRTPMTNIKPTDETVAFEVLPPKLDMGKKGGSALLRAARVAHEVMERRGVSFSPVRVWPRIMLCRC